MNLSDTNDSETSPDHPSVRIRGVALDMDGLLFDTEPLYWHVSDTMLQRRGFRFTTELQQRMMGRVAIAALEQMIDFHQLDDSPEQLLDESDQLYGDLLDQGPRPMHGLSQWIDLLCELGLPFGLATSSRRKFVDVIFSSVPWRSELAFILSGDDVRCGKPDPEIYLSAAARLGISPREMLVLEDSGNGCAAAVASGAVTIAIPSEHTRGQDFSGAVLLAESLTDRRLRSFLCGAVES